MLIWLATSFAGTFTAGPSEANPRPGQDVGLRMVWTNDSDQAVRVPTNILERASVSVERLLPGQRVRSMYQRTVTAVIDARRLKWTAVAPGESIQHVIPLSSKTAECEGGCRGGVYHVDANLLYPRLTHLAADQVVPEGSAFLMIAVEQEPKAVTQGLRLSLEELVRQDAHTFTAKARITNMTSSAVWIPEHLRVRCHYRYQIDGKEKTASTGLDRIEEPVRTTEALSTSLAAGASHTLATTCRAWPSAEVSGEFIVTIEPVSPFFQEERGPPPQVLGRRLETRIHPVPPMR